MSALTIAQNLNYKKLKTIFLNSYLNFQVYLPFNQFNSKKILIYFIQFNTANNNYSSLKKKVYSLLILTQSDHIHHAQLYSNCKASVAVYFVIKFIPVYMNKNSYTSLAVVLVLISLSYVIHYRQKESTSNILYRYLIYICAAIDRQIIGSCRYLTISLETTLIAQQGSPISLGCLYLPRSRSNKAITTHRYSLSF